MAEERGQREFSVPQGWAVEHSAGATTLTGPEGDLRISFVELEPRGNAQETALAAWQTIESEFASKVRQAVALPPQTGWDEGHQIVYEAPAKDARMEIAFVRRLGGRAYVNLVRGTTAALSRRGAQLTEAVTSWKPAGYREVTLKDAAGAPWTDQQSRGLKDFVLAAMATLQVPGVSVAVVQGGRMVYAEGFGRRSLGEDAPVTPRTRFMIGSTTKPLTTLLMARLIDQKKVGWSTLVADLLPGFALADSAMSSRLELRHTASASTGMPRQDMEFIFRYAGITPEDRLAQMKTMRPTTGFGETFQYSNSLVAAGGYAAARAFTAEGSLAEAFERAFDELVTRPLGMTDTYLRQEEALEGDAALPHALNFEGSASPLPPEMERFADSVAPAGALWSTAPDLARYVLLELGKGRMPEGERVVSEDVLLERRKKGVKIDQDNFYGLGLFVSETLGLRLIHHGGNTLGFSADLFFFPDKDLGFVVLTNLYAAVGFVTAFRQKVLELAFGAEAKAEATVAAMAKMTADGVALLRQKVATGAAAMEWVGELAGRYECAELGSALIEKCGDGFWVQFDEWGSALGAEVQPGGDRLLRLLDPPWRGSLRLLVDAGGETLRLDGGQAKYVFHREA